MSADLSIAYLAGIIDADGFISAHRKRHRDKVYCGPLIGIAGTSPEAHLLAKETWGGSFFEYIPKNPQHRRQYQWQSVGKVAARAIHDLQPHLRIKCFQAQLAAEMWNLITAGVHRTDERLRDIADRLCAANLRNPPLKQMTRKAPIPPDLMVRQFPTPRAGG